MYLNGERRSAEQLPLVLIGIANVIIPITNVLTIYIYWTPARPMFLFLCIFLLTVDVLYHIALLNWYFSGAYNGNLTVNDPNQLQVPPDDHNNQRDQIELLPLTEQTDNIDPEEPAEDQPSPLNELDDHNLTGSPGDHREHNQTEDSQLQLVSPTVETGTSEATEETVNSTPKARSSWEVSVLSEENKLIFKNTITEDKKAELVQCMYS